MRYLSDHEPCEYFWAADTKYCTHEAEPERGTEAWDQWMCNHQMSDDGPICLAAPAGTSCQACSEEHGEMISWSRCEVRDHARLKPGITPDPGVKHQPVPVRAGRIECLERECKEYFTDDGDEKTDTEVCSHLREETSCSCRRLSGDQYAMEPCSAAPATA